MNTQLTNHSGISAMTGAAFGAALGAIVGVTYNHTIVEAPLLGIVIGAVIGAVTTFLPRTFPVPMLLWWVQSELRH
jgi:uncharacterized membrane protein